MEESMAYEKNGLFIVFGANEIYFKQTEEIANSIKELKNILLERKFIEEKDRIAEAEIGTLNSGELFDLLQDAVSISKGKIKPKGG
jgi:hypothetical protein